MLLCAITKLENTSSGSPLSIQPKDVSRELHSTSFFLCKPSTITFVASVVKEHRKRDKRTQESCRLCLLSEVHCTDTICQLIVDLGSFAGKGTYKTDISVVRYSRSFLFIASIKVNRYT